MKKALILCVGVALVASMSSCKKDYTCKCTNAGVETTFNFADAKKSDAEDACNALAILGNSCTLSKK